MRPGLTLAGAASLLIWTGAALADMRTYPTESSATEEAIIAQGPYGQTYSSDAWLMGKLLEALARRRVQGYVYAPSYGVARPLPFYGYGTDRGSAEAAYDLLQLIKRVAAEKRK